MVMTSQCLGRRLSGIEGLNHELAVWESDRNDQQKRIDWQFQTQDARIKLKQLYPIVSS